MKTSKVIILICAVFLASCRDYLDTKPITEQIQQAQDPIPNAQDAENKLGAIYTQLGLDRVVFDPYTVADAQADVAYAGGDNPNNFQQDEHRTLTTNTNVLRDWDHYYNIIFRCNILINNVSHVNGLSEERKKEIKGAACLFRAYFYFLMARFWGEVPIVTTSVTSINSDNFDQIYKELFPPKSPLDAIYNLMVRDLEYAKDNTPLCNDANSLLANRGGAYALLAKVYATWPGKQDWDKVIEYCDRAAAGRALVPKFDDLFNRTDGTNEGNSEGIWVVNGYNQPLGGPRISINLHFGTQYKKFNTPSHALHQAYLDENDAQRLYSTIIFSDQVDALYPNVPGTLYAGIFEFVPVVSWSDPYWPSDKFPFAHKFRVPRNNQNLYWFRLSDILLLKAEALMNKGELVRSAEFVNQVRRRVNLPDLTFMDKQDAINKILKERFLELAYEGHRWHDLKRMLSPEAMIQWLQNEKYKNKEGRWVSFPYGSNLTPHRLLLPIPQVALDTNPNLVQNPGY